MIPRLYVDGGLSAGQATETVCAHYLRTVLRLSEGAEVELFNGRHGGWRGRISQYGKRTAKIEIIDRISPQVDLPDLALLFSPIKKTRLDFLVEKATELGVTILCPVLTDHSITNRVNERRLGEIAREAAEQCGRLSVPTIQAPTRLRDALADPVQRPPTLFVADETGQGQPALSAFGAADGPAAILVGPEGGFSAAELDLMRRLDIVTAIDLGPRVLRTETAAVAALACWQAVRGDWNPQSR